MSAIYVSTAILYSSLSKPTMSLQSALVDAQTEATTGQHAHLGLYLGAQAGFERSLTNQVAHLDGFKNTNVVVSARLDAAQAALDSVRSSAQSTLTALVSQVGTGVSSGSLASLGADGLASLTSAANTSAAGQYVFAGENAQTAPLSDYTTQPTSSAKAAIIAAFQSTFGFPPTDPQASTVSPSAMRFFLTQGFNAEFEGAGWASNWSTASASNPDIQVSPDSAISVPTSTNSSAFRSLAQAYTMIAEFGGASFGSDTRSVVASVASTLIAKGMAAAVSDEANIGSAQNRVVEANDQIARQTTLISQQIGKLDEVDINKVSVTINTLTTQIQTAYSLTARLKTLNLAQYI